MHGDLPKTFGQIHRAEVHRIFEPLDGILDAWQRINNLLTTVVYLSEVSEEPPSTALLTGQKNRRSEWAGGMSYEPVSDHLMSLLVNHLPHLWTSSVRLLGKRGLLGILHVGPVLNQVGFSIVSVVLGKSFFMLNLRFFGYEAKVHSRKYHQLSIQVQKKMQSILTQKHILLTNQIS